MAVGKVKEYWMKEMDKAWEDYDKGVLTREEALARLKQLNAPPEEVEGFMEMSKDDES